MPGPGVYFDLLRRQRKNETRDDECEGDTESRRCGGPGSETSELGRAKRQVLGKGQARLSGANTDKLKSIVYFLLIFGRSLAKTNLAPGRGTRTPPDGPGSTNCAKLT